MSGEVERCNVTSVGGVLDSEMLHWRWGSRMVTFWRRIQQRPVSAIPWDSSEIGLHFSTLEKHIFFLVVFEEATILDLSCSSYLCSSIARSYPLMLFDLLLATAGIWEPRWCLTRQKRQSYPVPLPIPCSGFILLTLNRMLWALLEFLPRPLITDFKPAFLYDLEHIC